MILQIIAGSVKQPVLVLRAIGLRNQFAEKVLEEIGGDDITRVLTTMRIKVFSRFDKDVPVTEYRFEKGVLDALKNQQKLNGWIPPTADVINDLSNRKSARVELVKRMLKHSSGLVSAYLFLSSDNSINLPQNLCLVTTDLKVYKDNTFHKYRNPDQP